MNARSAAAGEAVKTARRTPALTRASARARPPVAKNACTRQRQGVGQLGRDVHAGSGDQGPYGGAIEAVQVSHVLTTALRRRPRGGSVVLQRHLHHHGTRHPAGLAQQRHGIRHVLEHVRQQRQVVLAIRRRQRAAVEALGAGDLGPRLRQLHRALGDVEAFPASADPARGQRRQHHAVAAAQLHDRIRGSRQVADQRRHVVGLALGAQLPPPRIAPALLPAARVAALIFVAELR